MVQALSRLADVSTIGMMAREVYGEVEPRDDSIGLEHELLLWDRRPEIWHRWHSWRRLRRFYIEKTAREGAPDIVLVKNLGPSYDHFIRWLGRQRPRPLIVWVLADATWLGKKIPFSKRLRSLFKPMVTLDEGKAVSWFDGCISFSIDTRQYFEPRGIPWLWMPPAPNFNYEPPSLDPLLGGPIRFGYFGTLGSHSYILPTVQTFLNAEVPGTLRVCGHGHLSEALKQLSAGHANFHFDGLLRPRECLAWAQQMDVLINPRPPAMGLENSFPSKIFEYAMTGKAILSTRIGGVDQVLGTDGIYLETENLKDSLRQKLREIAGMNRVQLQDRGSAIRNRVLKDFNWDVQGRRVIEFLTGMAAARRRR
jgi:glycosyltransferase involved in cell wall biosynthesis